jgi:hypothetical protein
MVEKKICCHINFTTLNYFIFEMLKKKIWANFRRIIELFTQKIVTKLSKIWVWDMGSGIRKKPIPHPGPGVKKAPDPGSRIRNTGCSKAFQRHQRRFQYLVIQYVIGLIG